MEQVNQFRANHGSENVRREEGQQSKGKLHACKASQREYQLACDRLQRAERDLAETAAFIAASLTTVTAIQAVISIARDKLELSRDVLQLAFQGYVAIFLLIFLLGAFQAVPREQYEAASIEGAGMVDRFRFVTLPNVRTVLVIVVLFEVLMGLTAYDITYSMTAGGPGTATSLVSYFTWSEAFKQLNFGHGAALAVIIALVALVLITAILRALPRGALSEDQA